MEKSALTEEVRRKVDNGEMTINEARKKFGLSPIDGGDELLTTEKPDERKKKRPGIKIDVLVNTEEMDCAIEKAEHLVKILKEAERITESVMKKMGIDMREGGAEGDQKDIRGAETDPARATGD